MIKRFIVASIFMIGKLSIAQTSISIAPLMIGKAYFCSYPTDYRFTTFNTTFNNPDVANPYFSFSAKKISFRPGINLGIQVDLSLKNGKHRVGLEWATDASGTMSRTIDFSSANFVVTPPPPYKTYGAYTNYFQTAFMYNRLSLRYQTRLTKENSKADLYLIPDVTLTFGQPNSSSWFYDYDTTNIKSTYFYNDARVIFSEITSSYSGFKTFLLGLGLRLDLKTLNQKRYLFSIDLSCKLGYKTIVSSAHKYVIEDSGGVFGIVNGLSSAGSGMYLQLSRSFMLHSWKEKNGTNLQSSLKL